MIPVSQAVRDAVRYPRGVSMHADILRGNRVVMPKVPLASAKWELDSSSDTWLSADLDLMMTATDENAVLNVETARFRLYYAFTSLGYREDIPIGTCRIDEMNRTSRDSVSVSGSGLESYVIDARFLAPRTPPYGASTIQTIRDLILEVQPNAKVYRENTEDQRVLMTAAWEKERWDAVDALAASINARVYADWRGDFVIRDLPSIDAAPVFQIDAGESGLVFGSSVAKTRERRYNAAVVTSNNSDPNVPPFYGIAVDEDPNSPTYFYGDFGQVPRFYSSQFFSSDAQCVAIAQQQVAEAKTANRTVKFTAPMMPFLEPNDTVLLDTVEMTTEQHLIGVISGKLDADGDAATMSVQTLNSKKALEETAV